MAAGISDDEICDNKMNVPSFSKALESHLTSQRHKRKRELERELRERDRFEGKKESMVI